MIEFNKLCAIFVASVTACGCGAYTSFENVYSDMTVLVDGKMPELVEIERISLDELNCCVELGFKAFEIARRYELGVGGLPQRMDCAVIWYKIAARTPTTVVRRDSYLGSTGSVTYLGSPQSRAALRRIGQSSARVARSALDCSHEGQSNT